MTTIGFARKHGMRPPRRRPWIAIAILRPAPAGNAGRFDRL